MNKKQLIKRCLIDKDAIETYPFADDKYENTPILRHKSNNKWFGVVFEQDGKFFINLKAEPETIFILKDQYLESILPAWHMNKTHWCKVDVNNIEPEVLDAIIRKSFDITAPKRKNKFKILNKGVYYEKSFDIIRKPKKRRKFRYTLRRVYERCN